MRVQDFIVVLIIGILFIGASSITTTTQEIETHIQAACTLAWPNANEYKIIACTKRAMAALGDADRLRDNQLKQLLVDCAKELKDIKDQK